jgi:tetratricopeptide (TPR) repeat protein
MDPRPTFPLIVAFVADLMFAARIESVAHRMGYRLELIERSSQIAPVEDLPLDRLPGEHLVGPGAVLLDRLSAWGPALLIFDLNNHEIPWREWIPLLTSVPATRRIPVLCFGSHVDVEATQAARSAGATAVVARSRFTSALPELIRKYARIPDLSRLAYACEQPLSSLALKGLAEFNRGEYFEAHEYLELAWNEDHSPARELYRAILQVGVAYLQIERGNYNGAVKMFLRLRQWIDPLPPLCRGVDVARLREDARQVHQVLLALGPDQIADFDRNLFKPVLYETG